MATFFFFLLVFGSIVCLILLGIILYACAQMDKEMPPVEEPFEPIDYRRVTVKVEKDEQCD